MEIGREKFSGNQTWNRFPEELSISDPSQESGVLPALSLYAYPCKSFR